MPAARVKAHTRPVQHDTYGPFRYRILIRGQLDPSWADALGGLELAWDTEHNTVLTGTLLDQAALRGVLNRLLDLGSLLLCVTKEPLR